MNIAAVLILAVLVTSSQSAFADEPSADAGCASGIDFRIVGSWQAEDSADQRQFLPESRSLTPQGQPVTTQTCMAASDDLQEIASVEISPHLRSLTETHYHLGFIGLDHVMVTYPSGVMHLFRRIVAAPQRAIGAATHRRS